MENDNIKFLNKKVLVFTKSTPDDDGWLAYCEGIVIAETNNAVKVRRSIWLDPEWYPKRSKTMYVTEIHE